MPSLPKRCRETDASRSSPTTDSFPTKTNCPLVVWEILWHSLCKDKLAARGTVSLSTKRSPPTKTNGNIDCDFLHDDIEKVAQANIVATIVDGEEVYKKQ